MFADNTFTLRDEGVVTLPESVTTGLREGGVISPLLFSLFISDMCDSVLCPFTQSEFAQYLACDPALRVTPIPGLMYADDLIIFALNENLLRIRLRQLKIYAHDNALAVNVKKSKIVVFGVRRPSCVFRFDGAELPIRQSCKYLGIWLHFSGTSSFLE